MAFFKTPQVDGTDLPPLNTTNLTNVRTLSTTCHNPRAVCSMVILNAVATNDGVGAYCNNHKGVDPTQPRPCVWPLYVFHVGARDVPLGKTRQHDASPRSNPGIPPGEPQRTAGGPVAGFAGGCRALASRSWPPRGSSIYVGVGRRSVVVRHTPGASLVFNRGHPRCIPGFHRGHP